MKHTAPVLSNELLRFIHSQQPTVQAFHAWLTGRAMEGQFHILRKARLIEVNEDVVKLATAHLSQDGKWFIYGNALYDLESNEARFVCRGKTKT